MPTYRTPPEMVEFFLLQDATGILLNARTILALPRRIGNANTRPPAKAGGFSACDSPPDCRRGSDNTLHRYAAILSEIKGVTMNGSRLFAILLSYEHRPKAGDYLTKGYRRNCLIGKGGIMGYCFIKNFIRA